MTQPSTAPTIVTVIFESLMIATVAVPIILNFVSRAAGTGQAGQAKTGPLFSAFGWVMVVYFIYRMVKIVR